MKKLEGINGKLLSAESLCRSKWMNSGEMEKKGSLFFSFSDMKETDFLKAARIAQYKKEEEDFRNREEWPRLFKWFKERAEAFYETFSPRVKDLNPDEEKAPDK